MEPGNSNQYIPKYIQNVPWYFKTSHSNEEHQQDTLAHHRKDPKDGVIDHSEPQAGSGILDDVEIVEGAKTRVAKGFDAKRDRWHGHSAEAWDEILAKWSEIKSKAIAEKHVQEDSDDTDYELELQELGLDRSDLKSGHVEDPMEKIVRDRRDVPAYILAINANQGGRIRLGVDSVVSLVNEDSEFVKESEDSKQFKQMQKFAWEKNREFEAEQKKAHHEAQMASLKDPNVEMEQVAAADLNLSIEASPTLMMLKHKKNLKERQEAGEEKRRKIMSKYGSK